MKKQLTKQEAAELKQKRREQKNAYMREYMQRTKVKRQRKAYMAKYHAEHTNKPVPFRLDPERQHVPEADSTAAAIAADWQEVPEILKRMEAQQIVLFGKLRTIEEVLKAVIRYEIAPHQFETPALEFVAKFIKS